MPAVVVDRILARSEGNAFFAEELVAAGAIRADIALPDALADVLLGRIEALPELAQEILKVAAVAGRRVGHGLGHGLGPARGRGRAGPARRRRRAGAGGQRRHRELPLPPRPAPGGRLRRPAARRADPPPRHLRAPAGHRRPRRRGRPASAAELAWYRLASHDLPGGLAALVRAADHAATVFAPSEAYRLTQALEPWNRVPDAAAVAGVDWPRCWCGGGGGQPLRRVPAGRRPGQEAVETIDEDAEPLRAALAYDRLSSYLLDVEPEAT